MSLAPAPLLLLALLVAPTPLLASQDPGPRLEPPQLIEGELAPWPEDAHGPATEVGLAITLDETGTVVSVEVIDPAGPPFDEAAQEAISSFRFEPARRDGEAIPSRFRFRHPFTPPPPEPAQEPEPVLAPAPPPPADEELVVTVEGKTDAERRMESAEAVEVIETTQAQRQTADLGEVLARQKGVEVRRVGGLGSGTRFALNGLSDDQIRFFLDGVPLELAGFPYGISNVPVQMVRGIEIYRGVVPIRYGADALGGAVDLVTGPTPQGTGATASLQGGAFGTWRLTAGAHHHHEPTGLLLRAHLFADRSDNDYPIDVEAADRDTGRLEQVSVDRFHDSYEALGGGLEVGLVDRRWADRIALRLHGAGFDKELQHALVMTPASVPYGEAAWTASSWGSQLSYEKALSQEIRLDALLGHGQLRSRLLDDADVVYDWYGRTQIPRSSGELGERKRDEVTRQDAFFGRLNLAFRLAPNHELRLSTAPTLVRRTAEDRLSQDADQALALEMERSQLSWVSGVEYEIDLVDDRLEIILFAKDYRYAAAGTQPQARGGVESIERDLTRTGYGAAARLRLDRFWQLKASYEFATRLPRPDELFGDGARIVSNLGLAPETSHNLNLGVDARKLRTGIGELRGGINGFARVVDDLILLQQLGLQSAGHRNVGQATALGTELSWGWSAPGGLVHVDGNFTWQDFRNTSSTGAFAAYAGDRMIHRPWLFGNVSARLELRDVMRDRDELSPFWSSRYVHDFYLGWESAGDPATKGRVPSQLVQSAGVHYRLPIDPAVAGLTLEIDNLAGTKAFDFFGVQRPGRAAYLKGTVEF